MDLSGKKKGAPIIAARPKAVPLEREVARKDLLRAVGHSDAPAAVGERYLHVEAAFLGVSVAADNVKHVAGIYAHHIAAGRLPVTPINSRRKIGAIFRWVAIGEAGHHHRHI